MSLPVEVYIADGGGTRLRMLREAARSFVAHGLAETSGDAIARAFSMRTIRRHFRSREICHRSPGEPFNTELRRSGVRRDRRRRDQDR